MPEEQNKAIPSGKHGKVKKAVFNTQSFLK
jgi:hypothetical protein